MSGICVKIVRPVYNKIYRRFEGLSIFAKNKSAIVDLVKAF